MTTTLNRLDEMINAKYNNDNVIRRRKTNNVISEVIVHCKQAKSNDNVFQNVKKTIVFEKQIDADSIFSNVNKKTVETKMLTANIATKEAISALYDADNFSRRKFIMIAYDATMQAKYAFNFKIISDLFDQYNVAYNVKSDYKQSNADAMKSILCQSYRFEMYDKNDMLTTDFSTAIHCMITEKRSKRKY